MLAPIVLVLIVQYGRRQQATARGGDGRADGGRLTLIVCGAPSVRPGLAHPDITLFSSWHSRAQLWPLYLIESIR